MVRLPIRIGWTPGNLNAARLAVKPDPVHQAALVDAANNVATPQGCEVAGQLHRDGRRTGKIGAQPLFQFGSVGQTAFLVRDRHLFYQAASNRER